MGGYRYIIHRTRIFICNNNSGVIVVVGDSTSISFGVDGSYGNMANIHLETTQEDDE
jgi:hypothetical protein